MSDRSPLTESPDSTLLISISILLVNVDQLQREIMSLSISFLVDEPCFSVIIMH